MCHLNTKISQWDFLARWSSFEILMDRSVVVSSEAVGKFCIYIISVFSFFYVVDMTVLLLSCRRT